MVSEPRNQENLDHFSMASLAKKLRINLLKIKLLLLHNLSEVGISFGIRFVPLPSIGMSSSIHLDRSNYLVWCKHVLSAITAYGLEHIVDVNQPVPYQFLPRTYQINPKFSTWKNQCFMLCYVFLGRNSSPSIMFVESSSSNDNTTPWLLDSGATYHLTKDGSNLHSSSSYNGNDKITVGNDESLSDVKKGHSALCCDNKLLYLKCLAHTQSISEFNFNASFLC